MKLRVLGAYGAEAEDGKRASAFLLNERTLLDAGSVTSALDPAQQQAIEYVLVSHPHIDHVAGLAYLTEARAVYGVERPLTLCSVAPVLKHLKRSFFNNVAWPDFAEIPSREAPVLRYQVLADGREEKVGDFHVTAVPVDHTVDASGFIIRDGNAGLVYSGDTGPTEQLWQLARKHREVKAIILECSFPDRLAELADAAKHLTPKSLARELPKLPNNVKVFVFHIKPQFYDETAAELRRLNFDRIALLEQGRTYNIG